MWHINSMFRWYTFLIDTSLVCVTWNLKLMRKKRLRLCIYTWPGRAGDRVHICPDKGETSQVPSKLGDYYSRETWKQVCASYLFFWRLPPSYLDLVQRTSRANITTVSSDWYFYVFLRKMSHRASESINNNFSMPLFVFLSSFGPRGEACAKCSPVDFSTFFRYMPSLCLFVTFREKCDEGRRQPWRARGKRFPRRME